jgi:hypothetical protein
MAQDTVVQYVLKVDARGAQQALDKTSTEAKGASQNFDRLETSSKQAVQSLKRVETQAKQTSSQARNLRRAGRDLDGTFADLGQGASALSPALGSLFFTISDGASIAEATGRALTGFLNPAFAITATIAVAAGAAIFEFQREAEEAEAREQALADVIERTNKVIEEQTKSADDAAQSLIGYYQQVDQARVNLQLLTGQITQFEADQRAATQTAAQFGKDAAESQKQQEAAIRETIVARAEQIAQLRQQIALQKEERAIQQSLTERIAGAPQQFEEATFEEKQASNRLKTLQDQQSADRERLRVSEEQVLTISGQQRAYEQILQDTAKINEQERQRAQAERARQARLRKEAEIQRQREKEQQQVLKAQEQIEKILETAKFSQLDAVGKINATYEQQANKLFDLAETSGDIETANAALVELTKVRNQLLDDELAKQEALKQKEQERADKEAERAEKEAARKQAAAAKAQAEQVQEQIAKFEALVSLDASAILSLVAPVAGQILGILEQIGETTPEQKREAIAAQVEAVKQGLAQLPIIFAELIPLLAFGILEALTDGFRLLIINLIETIKKRFQLIGSLREQENRQKAREQFKEGVSRFFDPNQSTFMSGGRFIPKAQGGIRFTGMQDGLAMLHRGEFVVPQSGQRPQQVDRQLNNTTGGGMTVNINSAVVDRNAVDRLVREIEIRFNNQFGTSSSSLFGGR